MFHVLFSPEPLQTELPESLAASHSIPSSPKCFLFISHSNNINNPIPFVQHPHCMVPFSMVSIPRKKPWAEAAGAQLGGQGQQCSFGLWGTFTRPRHPH